MSLWFKSGTETLVLNGSGNLIDCGNCPCQGITYGECLSCDSPFNFAECWELTVAGVSDRDCTNCSNLNKTYTLLNTGACTRESSTDTQIQVGLFCAARYADWRIYKDGSGWHLGLYNYNNPNKVSPQGFVVVYDISTTFDCEGTNTFDSISTNGTTCNWPSSLTIEPVSCP